MKVLESNCELIENFGRDRKDGETVKLAEKILEKVIAPKKFANCNSFNDLRVKNIVSPC